MAAMVVPRRKAGGWDTAPEDAALVEEVSAPARGIASLAWLRPFASLQQLDLCHNRLTCLDGSDACRNDGPPRFDRKGATRASAGARGCPKAAPSSCQPRPISRVWCCGVALASHLIFFSPLVTSNLFSPQASRRVRCSGASTCVTTCSTTPCAWSRSWAGSSGSSGSTRGRTPSLATLREAA